MKSNLQHAFDLNMSHSYFKDGNCECIDFSFGKQLTRLKKRFDLIKRQNQSGFSLYINSRMPLKDLFQYISDTTGNDYFDFDMKVNDPAFRYFTDLPASLSQFVYATNSTINNKNCQINTELVPSEEPRSGGALFGRLIIYFSHICADNPVKFSINFQAIKTEWQYYFIIGKNKSLKYPVITGKIPVEFTGPEAVKIATGQDALKFTSGNYKLPLSEVPYYKFSLVNFRSGTDRSLPLSSDPVINGLPSPNPLNNITFIEGQTVNTISPMYIYV